MASIETAYGDYKDLVKSLENGDSMSMSNVYEQIMTKEQNRIDLINRVVEQKENKTWSDTLFYNHSLMEIAILFASTWRTIFNELLIERRFDMESLQHILYDGDRKIYTGIMMILISVFLYFIHASV